MDGHQTGTGNGSANRIPPTGRLAITTPPDGLEWLPTCGFDVERQLSRVPATHGSGPPAVGPGCILPSVFPLASSLRSPCLAIFSPHSLWTRRTAFGLSARVRQAWGRATLCPA